MANDVTSTSGQEPTAGKQFAGAQGTGYSAQAADAGADERSGTDGGRSSPSSTTTDETHESHESHESHDALTDPAALRAALEAARKEAAQNRKAAKELEALRNEIETAKLSETEKLQKQLAEAQRERDLLTQTVQERVMRAEVRVTAQELGIKPELALRIIDPAQVAFDELGDPTNVRELIEQAMQAFGLTASVSQQQPPSPAYPAAGQPGVVARVASPVASPATGATNPPRSGQIAGPNGSFGRDEIPRLTDPRLWRRS